MLTTYDDSSEEARVKNNQICLTNENLAAIQVKHQIENENKQRNQDFMDQQQNQKQVTMLSTLADKINHMIQFQQGSTIPLNKIIERILNDF